MKESINANKSETHELLTIIYHMLAVLLLLATANAICMGILVSHVQRENQTSHIEPPAP